MDPVSGVGTDAGSAAVEIIKLLIPVATLAIGLVGGHLFARSQSTGDWKRQRRAFQDDRAEERKSHAGRSLPSVTVHPLWWKRSIFLISSQ